MAKEEIKFVKKKGEKGLKKIFNDQDGEDFMKNTLGVQKKSMKKGGQVEFSSHFERLSFNISRQIIQRDK